MVVALRSTSTKLRLHVKETSDKQFPDLLAEGAVRLSDDILGITASGNKFLRLSAARKCDKAEWRVAACVDSLQPPTVEVLNAESMIFFASIS